MTNINHVDVQNLYKLNSNDTVTTPCEDYAKADLKSASWMTRTVISLREPSQYAFVNKISNFVAGILNCLLFKSSKTFIARRAEILNFDFKAPANTTKLVEAVFGKDGFKTIPADAKREDNLFTEENSERRHIQLRTADDKKELQMISQMPDGNTWKVLGNAFENKMVDMIAGGKLTKNSEGEFYYDIFANLVQTHFAKQAEASKK